MRQAVWLRRSNAFLLAWSVAFLSQLVVDGSVGYLTPLSIFTFVAVSTTVYLIALRASSSEGPESNCSWRIAGVCVVSLHLSLLLAVNYFSPFQAWDLFGNWREGHAQSIIAYVQEGPLSAAGYLSRQPLLMKQLAANFVYVSVELGAPHAGTLWAFVPLIWLALLAADIGANYKTVAVFLFPAIVTMPLVENHILVAGYNEVALGVAVLHCCISARHPKAETISGHYSWAILALMFVCSVKSVGILFAGAICFGWLLLWWRPYLIAANVFGLAVLVSIAFFLLIFVCLELLALSWAGVQLTVSPENLVKSPEYLYAAFVHKSSFGVTGCVAITILFLSGRFAKSSSGSLSSDLVLFSGVLLGVICASLSFSYFFENAAPNSDSMLSRGLIGVMPLFVLTAMVCVEEKTLGVPLSK